MNQCINAILERRSIRTFRKDPIPQETVELLLAAAISAPSSMNRQARHYAVFQGRAAVDGLDAAVKKATALMPENRYFKRVTGEGYTIHYQAPLFVMIMADPAVTTSPEADCATALQNMFLAARSLGIGSCWINQLNPLHEEPGFRDYMSGIGIPKGFVIYGCGAFGYPEGDWPGEPKRNSGNITWVES